MDFLFGHLYLASSPTFTHDQMMLKTRGAVKSAVVGATRLSTAGSVSSDNADPMDLAGSKHRGHRDGRRAHEEMSREERRREGRRREGRRRAAERNREERSYGDRHTTIDHYSPTPSPPSRKRKSISQTPLEDDDALSGFRKEAAELEARANALGTNASTSTSGQRRAWGEHGTASVLANWPSDSKRAKVVQSSNYGRLSPPPAKCEYKATPGYPPRGSKLPSTDAREREPMPRQPSTDHARQSEHAGRRNKRSESEQAEVEHARNTMRNDAYVAAEGKGELQWSDIGLVSSGGHQLKEEEL